MPNGHIAPTKNTIHPAELVGARGPKTKNNKQRTQIENKNKTKGNTKKNKIRKTNAVWRLSIFPQGSPGACGHFPLQHGPFRELSHIYLFGHFPDNLRLTYFEGFHQYMAVRRRFMF